MKLHWAFQSRDAIHFVMDFCPGGELFFLLSRIGRFSEPTARFYFAEILLGLEALHARNVMYRDLKPENVLLDVDGHVKLADFGLSKDPEGPLSYSFCGSPEYMSPEMLAAAGHDWRVDLYSLGAILYEMLTGLPPFYNSDTKIMYDAIVHEQLCYPSYLSEAAIALLSELLEKDPD